MEITLNAVEQRLTRFLAKERHASNRKAGVTNAKVGPQSDEDTDLEGIAAEIAYCKAMNVYPDLSLDARPTQDAFSTEHGGVDIKATKYKNGNLIARRCKSGYPPDSYALMIGEFPSYRFVGWIPAQDLLQSQNITDLGYGETYAMVQPDLFPARRKCLDSRH